MKLAEPIIEYNFTYQASSQWVEVLVDCVYAEGLYTYKNKPDTSIKAGDIVSIPFGSSIVGGVVVKILSQLPDNLDSSKIKEIDDIVSSGFFPPHYWELLELTANYYLTDLINVIRVALPPKLLGRSQRRVRLLSHNIPENPEDFCSVKEWEVIKLLQKILAF